jgi:hypothetical protein
MLPLTVPTPFVNVRPEIETVLPVVVLKIWKLGVTPPPRVTVNRFEAGP